MSCPLRRLPRMQRWLDAGHSSCILGIESVRSIVKNALRHFDGREAFRGRSKAGFVAKCGDSPA